MIGRTVQARATMRMRMRMRMRTVCYWVGLQYASGVRCQMEGGVFLTIASGGPFFGQLRHQRTPDDDPKHPG